MSKQKPIIVLLGPQGSGKGTQAELLSQTLGVPHISTGALFREAVTHNTERGDKLQTIMSRGELVPDELTFEILRERLAAVDCTNGYILDGFPRTLAQAELLDNVVSVTAVVLINISDAEALKRLENRRQDPETGKIYNLYTAPKPPTDIVPRLVQRADDTADAIKQRLAAYHEQTKPLLAHYGDRVVHVNGEQTIAAVSQDIQHTLKPLI